MEESKNREHDGIEVGDILAQTYSTETGFHVSQIVVVKGKYFVGDFSYVGFEDGQLKIETADGSPSPTTVDIGRVTKHDLVASRLLDEGEFTPILKARKQYEDMATLVEIPVPTISPFIFLTSASVNFRDLEHECVREVVLNTDLKYRNILLGDLVNGFNNGAITSLDENSQLVKTEIGLSIYNID